MEIDNVMPQAVILCGGLGTRLGSLTDNIPKPLLPVGDLPFLEILIQEIGRSGTRHFLLLAGHMADQIQQFAAGVAQRLGTELQIEIAVEQGRAGTAGALIQARDRLHDMFFLFNGDSFFDISLHRLAARLNEKPQCLGVIALREVTDASRFGSVKTHHGRITEFEEKRASAGPGVINAGVYLFRREILDFCGSGPSLEQDALPGIAAAGRLAGVENDGFFIDIGLPETYRDAEAILQSHRSRKAVFLDRDGVINIDRGHVGSIDRFEFVPGAPEAIRLFNDAGYYVFVVTNQAGLAKGHYSIEDYWRLRDHMRSRLFEIGAQIDDERFCPFHPDGIVEEWRGRSDWRKPGSGMLRDLMASWPVNCRGSFLIGDQPSDMQAAESAGLPAFQFHGGNLLVFASHCLETMNGLED